MKNADTKLATMRGRNRRNTVLPRRLIVILVLSIISVLFFKLSFDSTSFNFTYSLDHLHPGKNDISGNTHQDNDLRLQTLSNHSLALRKQYGNVRLLSKVNNVSTISLKPLPYQTGASKVTLTLTTTRGEESNGITSNLQYTTPESDKSTTTEAQNKSLQSSLYIKHKLKTYSSSNTNRRQQRIYHPNAIDKLSIKSGRFVSTDLMNEGPLNFLPNYKNPCWVDIKRNITDPPVRCLPYFYLIGAPKSGTTDLFKRLVQHQQVSDYFMKEPHWLARRHYYGRKGRSDLSNYLKIFAAASRELFFKKDKNGYHYMIIGDCSASTMWDNDYWTILPQFEHLKEPLYTNADYIHHLNPKAKIIAILRNPVDRLYSDYLFFNKNATADNFHIETEKILRDFTSCLKTLTLRQCIYKPQVYYSTSPVRLRIGIYHQHIKEYFRVFPREQIFVINLEKFSSDTSSYMKAVFSFLQLSPMNDTKLIKVADPNQHANARRGKASLIGDMKPETRILLQEFYYPHNKELVDLLGEDFIYNP